MARDFKFRLEPVLEMRQNDEERAKEQLALTMGLRTQSREMLEAANNLIDTAASNEREAKEKPVTVQELIAQQAWRERLERYKVRADQQLEEVETEVTLSRNALIDAHQRRAALDKLKDIKRNEHNQRIERFEAAEADEIALRQHHGRKRRAS
jgi:flagellar export protein FliJ